jgi:DNA repair protein RadD
MDEGDGMSAAVANDLWPHQAKGIADVMSAIVVGHKRILLASPTGMGKTRMVEELARIYLERSLKVAFYTNRRMLVEQASRDMRGLDHGIRAAMFHDDREKDFQICSMQTQHARRNKWDIHAADLVIVDEAHIQSGPAAQKVLAKHRERGAVIVGPTATPIGMADMYDVLIQAGTNSEGRACGALLPCITYGPDEPDMKHAKTTVGNDFTENDIRKALMATPQARKAIFARVLHWWQILNPEQKPTILFAPGVAESIWFCEQFREQGIRAAHIDGEECWLDGEFHKSDRGIRDEILEGSKYGTIKVISNRFVLREGINAPWLAHGIAATVFGSLQSFLQSGGRLLRNHDSLDSVTWQDHGGNWHRHGSLNADRIWQLDYTANMITGMRQDAMREKRDPEPIRCSKCSAIRVRGRECPKCGHVDQRRSRPVAMTDGSLKEYVGDIYKPRRIAEKPNTAKIWEQCYYRAKASKNEMTFRQAEGLFFYENHYYPPRTLKLMPTNDLDWFRKVKDVPKERLT